MKSLCKLITVLLVSTSVFAAGMEQGIENITVSNAHVRALPPTVKNTAAYFTINNHGAETLSLLGGYSDVADSVQLHETLEENGMMHMRHRMSAEIPAGGDLVLESGGLHLMIMGLNRVLAPGDSINLTLEFNDDQTLTIEVPVRSVMAEAMSHEHH